ncbi:XkdF-like putative serine protease domain-containing protein [Hymenobacter tenuis]
MAKKAPIYAVQISDNAPEQGVSLVSFVETPAIGVNFVALSAEQPVRVCLKADSKKQILTGPVLIPDLKIARLAEDKKSVYYITFSAEVIEQLRDRFHEQNNTQATNLQHETPLEGNHVVESWIVTDATKDKAYALGFSAEEVPVGTWMASYKVPDAQLWADEVETGKVKGFSMEGLLGYTTLSKFSMQKNPKPANKMAAFFAGLKKLMTSVELATLVLDDDSSIEIDEETGEVFTLDADNNRGEKLADGTYKLKEGGELIVKDGKKQEATSEKSDEDEKLEATALDAGTYALPGGDELTITADAYSIAKADGAESLSEVNVALESIAMADGTELQYNPITRRLTTAEGKMLESGNYACADGSYFEVSTSQYTYQIDKATYDKAQKLSSVETQLAASQKQVSALELKLKAKPAASPVKLAGDKNAEKQAAEEEKPQTAGQQLFARTLALSGLKD